MTLLPAEIDDHLRAPVMLTVYTYYNQDSKLLAPIVYFTEPV